MNAPARTAYDRIAIGDEHVFGTCLFTAEAILRFAKRYDPLPFHLDPAAGVASRFGGLAASGWHTAAAMMRLLVDYFDALEVRERAAGRPAILSGPSPGFDDLRWLRPVLAGDTITYTARVVGKRASQSRPGWGLLSMTTTGVNQRGEPVFSITTHVFISTRH
jgi:acyl dehydratase